MYLPYRVLNVRVTSKVCITLLYFIHIIYINVFGIPNALLRNTW